MEARKAEIPQWMMWATVLHGPKFGHALTLTTVSKNRDPYEVARWSWTGIGVPSGLLEDAQTRACSVLAEHLTTRYGVSVTLF